MKKSRTYLGITLAVAAVALMTACVPQGANVGLVAGDVAVADGGDAAQASTLAEAAGVPDREPYVTRTPMSLAVSAEGAGTASVDAVLPTPTPEPTSGQDNGEPTTSVDPDAAGTAPPVSAVVAPVNAEPGSIEPDTVATAVIALSRVDDVDPAPPFAVLVDSVRLVEGGATYKVTGWIRNDGAETYEGIGLEATFYDGSAWHFGPFDAICACYTLEPGQSCAFSAEAYARDYTEYRLHPEGAPLKAWTGSPTALTVTDAVVAGIEAGYVRLTGVVQNQTGSAVNAVRVSVALMDSDGAVTGVGTTIVAGQLAPGAETSFSLRVLSGVYASHNVTAEAELQ